VLQLRIRRLLSTLILAKNSAISQGLSLIQTDGKLNFVSCYLAMICDLHHGRMGRPETMMPYVALRNAVDTNPGSPLMSG